MFWSISGRCCTGVPGRFPRKVDGVPGGIMPRRAVPWSALAAAIRSMRVPLGAGRPGVPNGDCTGVETAGVTPLGACMLCEGLP
eukprot:830212-Pyramimonas_sp.AAC.1